MNRKSTASEFIQYLLISQKEGENVPSLNELSSQLGISVARLREQVEVAKALGLVEIRPRTGIRRLPYSFLPAVRQILSYGIEANPACFSFFSDLRNHIEAAYWDEAVRLLTLEDQLELQALIKQAWQKLHGEPVQIPHAEHRELHLLIYRRLNNPFVLGILEAYWEAYVSVGLALYADYQYLEQVWVYHQKMVEAVCAGDYEAGYQALLEHKDLLLMRPHSEYRERSRNDISDSKS